MDIGAELQPSHLNDASAESAVLHPLKWFKIVHGIF